jgi:hypothetical protein
MDDADAMTLRLEDFLDDAPWTPSPGGFADVPVPDLIEGSSDSGMTRSGDASRQPWP